jgi:hypothetical protein
MQAFLTGRDTNIQLTASEHREWIDKPMYNQRRVELRARLSYPVLMSDRRRSLIRKLEHIESFPLIGLQAIRELRDDLAEVEAEAILRAREMGASLEDIAESMGLTRQGVAYRVRVLSQGVKSDTDVIYVDADQSEGAQPTSEPDPQGMTAPTSGAHGPNPSSALL